MLDDNLQFEPTPFVWCPRRGWLCWNLAKVFGSRKL